MDGQEEALGGGVAPLHGLEEERKGAGAHLVHRSHDGGEGGGGELAEREPIKADDGDGARDLDSGIVKKPEQADRDGIAEGDDGGGFLSCALPEAATGGGPPGKGQFARLVQPGIGGEAKPLEMALKGAPALLDGQHGGGAGEVADAAMAAFDEGVEDQSDSRQIVGGDLVKDGRAELAVDEDDLEVAFKKLLPERGQTGTFGEEGRCGDDAAHMEGRHGADPIDILVHVVGAIADQNVVPGLAGGVLDGANHLGVVGVAAVGNDDANKVGATSGEGAGDLVGLVVKLADGGVNPLAGALRDPGMVTQGERDGHGRKAQPFPDVAQCHLLLQPVTSRAT